MLKRVGEQETNSAITNREFRITVLYVFTICIAWLFILTITAIDPLKLSMIVYLITPISLLISVIFRRTLLKEFIVRYLLYASLTLSLLSYYITLPLSIKVMNPDIAWIIETYSSFILLGLLILGILLLSSIWSVLLANTMNLWGVGIPPIFRIRFYAKYYSSRSIINFLITVICIVTISYFLKGSIMIMNYIVFFAIGLISPIESIISIIVQAIIIYQTITLIKKFLAIGTVSMNFSPFLGICIGSFISFILVTLRYWKRVISSMKSILIRYSLISVTVIGTSLLILTKDLNAFVYALIILSITFLSSFTLTSISNTFINLGSLPVFGSKIVFPLTFILIAILSSITSLYSTPKSLTYKILPWTMLVTITMIPALLSDVLMYTIKKVPKNRLVIESKRIFHELLVCFVITFAFASFYLYHFPRFEVFFVSPNIISNLTLLKNINLIIDYNLLSIGLLLSIIIGVIRFLLGDLTISILMFNPITPPIAYLISLNFLSFVFYLLGGVVKCLIIFLILLGRVMNLEKYINLVYPIAMGILVAISITTIFS